MPKSLRRSISVVRDEKKIKRPKNDDDYLEIYSPKTFVVGPKKYRKPIIGIKIILREDIVGALTTILPGTKINYCQRFQVNKS